MKWDLRNKENLKFFEAPLIASCNRIYLTPKKDELTNLSIEQDKN